MFLSPGNSKCRKAFCFEFCFLNFACFICFYSGAVLFSHIDYRSYFSVFFYEVHYRNAKFFCFCIFLTCFVFLCIHLYCIGFFYFFRSSCILVFHGNLNFSIFRIDLFACAVQEVNIVCKETCNGIFFILSFFFKSGCYIFILCIFALNWSYNKLCIIWKNIFCSCCSYNYITNSLRIRNFFAFQNILNFFCLITAVNNLCHITSYVSLGSFPGNLVPSCSVLCCYGIQKCELCSCVYSCQNLCLDRWADTKIRIVSQNLDQACLTILICCRNLLRARNILCRFFHHIRILCRRFGRFSIRILRRSLRRLCLRSYLRILCCRCLSCILLRLVRNIHSVRKLL